MFRPTQISQLSNVFFSFTLRRRAYTSFSELDKEKQKIERLLNNTSVGKKDKGRLRGRLNKLKISTGIKRVQEDQATKPKDPSILSKNKQFKAVQYDQKILEYIKRHKLHSSREPQKLFKEYVNPFVASVRKLQTPTKFPSHLVHYLDFRS
jgi:hypothetical protein